MEKKLFEIHITGDKTINDQLNDLNLKNIIVDLLFPDMGLYRTEYMSSYVVRHESFGKCIDHVYSIVSQLKSPIYRIKIETPYYEDLVPFSLYMESHFEYDKDHLNHFPISRNQRSGKLMCTAREYNKENYKGFMELWKGKELELCLFDSFKEEDFDWFKFYFK